MKYVFLILILLLSVINASGAFPVQSSVYDLAYANEAYIIWETNIPSDNRVEYSLNSDMSASLWSDWDNTTTTPKIFIETLNKDDTYYYEVSSINAGDTTTSSTLSFNTQNNTHGFSKHFDRIFTINPFDGWGVGQSMVQTYVNTVGEYVFFTLFITPIFLVIALRTESVVIPTVLALIGTTLLFPLLPPEFDLVAKVILSLAIAGTIWHFFIGRR